ncbi:recombinase family protein [Azospirillum oryzae]|uniref:Recombinase family protein n=1 Tax=Azospirillum oryzae TaxID=286727 RepID=A0A6N1AJ82_9PROT|nr:recombinase family protein [Azospirillum oryzae]KAA0589952.1 recombinase family protein [Azospirillum oryzae]QKS51791.1 recombinase family protein [Azospirillum oryzae]
MTLAFSYIRMSTPEQLKGDSLRRQLERSRRLAEARGWTLDETFRDLGKSAYRGTHIESGAFGEFLERVRAGKVPTGSVLIVESLDRLSRETVPVALQTFLGIINAGLVLVTLDSEPPREFRADSANVTFDLMLSILELSRAHAESRRKSDLLKPAWENKRRQAREDKKPLTRRLPMWIRIVDGQFEIIPERAEVVREIFELSVAGIGREKLVKLLNGRGIPAPGGGEWGKSGISHILDTPAVIGRFQPSETYYENGRKLRRPVGDIIEGYFPPVIPVDLYNRAHAARQSRSLGYGGRTGWTFSNIFRGLCYCGACGGKMEYFNKGNNLEKGGRYFMCASVKRGSGCQERVTYRYVHFERAFLDNCHHFDFSRLNAAAASDLQHVRERIAELALEQTDLNKRYATILELAETNGLSDRIRTRVAELETALDLNAAEQDKLRVKEATLAHSGQSDTIRQLLEVRGRMETATGEDLYRIRAQLSAMIREFTVGIVFWNGIATVAVGNSGMATPFMALYMFNKAGKLLIRTGLEFGPSTDQHAVPVGDIGTGTPEELQERLRAVDATLKAVSALKARMEPTIPEAERETGMERFKARWGDMDPLPASASLVLEAPG